MLVFTMLPTPGARNCSGNNGSRSPPVVEGVRELLRPAFGCFAGSSARLRAGCCRGDGARGFDSSFARGGLCAFLFLPFRRFAEEAEGAIGGGGGIALTSSCSLRTNGVGVRTGDLEVPPVASFRMRPSKSFRANLKQNKFDCSTKFDSSGAREILSKLEIPSFDNLMLERNAIELCFFPLQNQFQESADRERTSKLKLSESNL